MTFVSDQSADFAQSYLSMKWNDDNEQFFVRPACTLEQPQDLNNRTPVQQQPSMLGLNNNALLHIFKFLDLDSALNMAEVCILFEELLDQHYFPHVWSNAVMPMKTTTDLVENASGIASDRIVKCYRSRI